MENQPQILEQLAEAQTALELAKNKRREVNNSIRLECLEAPNYSRFEDERKSLGNSMKAIKLEVLERTGLKTDLDNATLDVKLQKDVISGLMANLLREGGAKPGEEMRLPDGRAFMPDFNIQLKLL